MATTSPVQRGQRYILLTDENGDPVIVDGKVVKFETQQECDDYQRNPLVIVALNEMVASKGGSAELATYLFDNKAELQSCLAAGKARKRTAAETAALTKALKNVVASGNPDFQFIIDNADSIRSSHKFEAPRMSEDARFELAKSAIAKFVDNADASGWIIANISEIKDAWNTGRVLPGGDGLRAYQEEQATKREAKKAAAALLGA